MEKRLEIMRKNLKLEKADGILVTNCKNIFYLSGFRGVVPDEREALFVMTMRHAILVVPKMYEEDAKKLPLVKNGCVKVRSIIVKKGFFGTALSLFGRSKKKVIIESRDLSVFEYEHISKDKLHTLNASSTFCEEMRVVKDATELRLLKRSARITDTVFSKVLQFLERTDYTQITEQELADKMLTWGKEVGADDWAFAPIIASGVGSALPHYHTGKKKLKKNAPLLMDFGFVVNSYNSDMSRTIFLGKAPESFKKNYEIVRNVQEECVNYVCPGVETNVIDQYARVEFEQYNVEDRFIHSLGHGLGLDVHELPFVGPTNGTLLKEGMVITIEPGIYFPHKYGIRIEDDVVVTKNGQKVLNNAPKALIEI